MISKKDVKHIANLARLGLTPKEAERFKRELSSILDYVGKLKKVDVAKVLATSHPLALENVMRRDEASKKKQKLLEGFLRVKSILK